MLRGRDGAQGRSDATVKNHLLSGAQPSLLTDASPPSPEAPLSNLSQSLSEVEFKGYAAVFNTTDGAGDTIRPGAFARSLGEGRAVPLYLEHRWGRRIGRLVELAEDEWGLHVRGRIDSAEALKHVTERGIDGLSFGYRARDYRRVKAGRELHDIELIEVSVVRAPLNPGARFRLLSAQGMSAGTAKTPKAVEGEARQPGPPTADAPNPFPHPQGRVPNA